MSSDKTMAIKSVEVMMELNYKGNKYFIVTAFAHLFLHADQAIIIIK